VLSTDIAESSLTIEGVRVVVDAGFARVPVYAVGSLGSSLRTVKAAIANVDQRRGRAGRTEPGVCYRLWHEEENRGLPKAPQAEILNTDLSSMILRLAFWGDADPFALNWLDPPSHGQVKAATTSLNALGLIDDRGHLTSLGQNAVRLPLSPRLAMLILSAENDAERALGAQLAALLSETGAGGKSPDISDQLARFQQSNAPRIKALKSQARKWADTKAEPDGDEAGLLARAWPDRISRARPGDAKRFQLAGGGGARLPDHSPFEGEGWLVICETGGASAGEPIIRLASRLDERTARAVLPKTSRDYADYDEKTQKIRARRQETLGEIVLSETPLSKPDKPAIADAVLRAISEKGLSILPGFTTLSNFQKRAAFAARLHSEDWPPLDDDSLIATRDDWLRPALEADGLKAIESGALVNALRNWLGWNVTSEIDRLAPVHWHGPNGHAIRIDYTAEQAPLVAIRPQDLYGQTLHPCICDGRVPLTLSLLSPAQRQIALTRDLPGFWTGGYVDMRKDMKGRYPKHDWPEDPANASPPKPRNRG
jgi:ATP-dependent helicase HrpB